FYRGSYGAMSVYRTATGTIYGSRQALDPVTGDIAYAYMASTWNPLWRLSDATGTSYASGGLDSGGRSSSRVGSGVTVAYGPDGTLYAAWHDAVEGDIKFATYDAALASWTTETVSSPAGYYPHDLDLTIDSVGNAHIVYAMNYGTNGYYPFTYATNSSGSWALTSLATAADHPTFCEIQVDSMDMVHIFGILDTSKYLMHYYIY
ncbi:MAG TPA: hypothetical protein PKW90_23580, partial [Myxococcota bacterium]|nr:hypothetical protein [Myxococcota bacterium]